jgi:hypothetical protein
MNKYPNLTRCGECKELWENCNCPLERIDKEIQRRVKEQLRDAGYALAGTD